MRDDDSYLIWSNEHRSWWRPGEHGYTRRWSEAGRYTHDAALRICTKAIPGTAQDLGALPELPVRAADVQMMQERFRGEYPGLPKEPWE